MMEKIHSIDALLLQDTCANIPLMSLPQDYHQTPILTTPSFSPTYQRQLRSLPFRYARDMYINDTGKRDQHNVHKYNITLLLTSPPWYGLTLQ